ncbi:VSIG4 protein, partial [Oceanites oceanicus]|nr:VSIG4 protein [Oceanites oceanicus]
FSFSILPAAFLDLTGPNEIEGVWKGPTTLPCAYEPVEGFVQQTLTWTVVHDQSSGTVFRRDGSGDHVLLSEYRGRVSVLKNAPGNVSLHILSLEVSDRGIYTCQVTWRASNNSLIVKEIAIKVEVVKASRHCCGCCDPGGLLCLKVFCCIALDFQRSHLSVYLVILIAVVCGAVVFLVIFLIVCIRKPKD